MAAKQPPKSNPNQAPQVLLIADRPQAVIQEGQPPAQMAAWLLDIPDGSDALAVATGYATDQGFPVGTVVRMVDLSARALTIQMLKLTTGWEQVDGA